MEKKVWETPKLEKLDTMLDTLNGASGTDTLGGS